MYGVPSKLASFFRNSTLGQRKTGHHRNGTGPALLCVVVLLVVLVVLLAVLSAIAGGSATNAQTNSLDTSALQIMCATVFNINCVPVTI